MIRIRTPAVVVNFKAYAEAQGPKATHISAICDEIAHQTGVCIAVSPPLVELSCVANSFDIPVLSQHVDQCEPGSNTGWITPEMVKACGAAGTLLNHSERRVPLEVIERTVKRCKDLDLEVIVCAENIDLARRVAAFSPPYIAIEPPELIGGDVSVTTARPEIVSGTVDAVHDVDSAIRVLCGAGVKTGEDVEVALDLGAEGVLLASGVVKAVSIKNALLDLVSGL